jgi:hypothetical protein
MFKRKTSRIIFGLREGEVRGEWGQIHSEKLLKLCASPVG